jgi:DNA-binding transcriptional MerR regulator
MNAFTIKDLENLSGIKAHTIRIWEQRYSFLKPQRTTTNIRFYTNTDLKLILNIALLNRHGFKISHISKMSNHEMERKILSLSQNKANEERVINDLIQSMVELRVDEFESLLTTYINSNSFEEAVRFIIFPFLERIGILWQTNHINPAQEHLVSNIIRQKVIVAIDELSPGERMDKMVLLFLPENEHHELGLLFSYYLIRKQGVGVLYLGASVPLRDLHFIVERKNPAYLYSHITSLANPLKFEKFLAGLQNQVKNLPVIISGHVAQAYRKPAPSNIAFKRSLSEVEEFVASL